MESPANTTLCLIDITHVACLVHSQSSKPLVFVDNTFLSPFYPSPLLLGVDIALHPLTKYVNGHSGVGMGALFLPADHTAFIEKLKFLQNTIGAVPSTYDSWLAQRGEKMLHFRTKEDGKNALAVAKALQKEEGVLEVVYLGLPGKTEAVKRKNALVWQVLSPAAIKSVGPSPKTHASSPPAEGFPLSGMISVRLRGGREEGEKVLTSVQLFTLAQSLADVESLAEHPVQMTHGSIPPADRELLGIGDSLVRLSVGAKDEEYLVDDIVEAVGAATGTTYMRCALGSLLSH